jgi:hypothetical protein
MIAMIHHQRLLRQVNLIFNFFKRFYLLMIFEEENNKRARKRQRTDSVEKLKTFENKVVIEIKLPDEMKTSLSRDWHLINNEHKVKHFY